MATLLKNDLHGKAVLITGGTKGIGLATALAFAREGAHLYLTHKWGSADEDALRRSFAELGAPAPVILEADAAVEEDAERVVETIQRDHDRVEVFLSNVSFAQVVSEGLDSYTKRALSTSLGYSAWPFVGYLQQIKKTLGRYPRYVLGSSCDGPDTYYPGYDFVAASKEVMEVLCRYLAVHLLEEDVRVNILRSRPISTDSLRATFGEEYEPFLKKYFGDEYFITAEEFADAVLALCSGLMDAVSGQVILLDRGVGFCDNLMRLFEERAQFGL